MRLRPSGSTICRLAGNLSRRSADDSMSRYDFLVDTYRTERLKTLSVWSQVPDDRMAFRPEPRARTAHEHMVHQCVSEDGWMRTMLGITVSLPVLPTPETRQ